MIARRVPSNRNKPTTKQFANHLKRTISFRMVFSYICFSTTFIKSMIRLINSLLISTLFCVTLQAQTPEKVRGNKKVTVQQTQIDAFHTIVVNDDFEIDIIYNQTPSVTIETDENLHEFISFNVNAGVLTFHKTARITSKKALHITVNYDASLANIKVADKGEITSLTTMELANTIVITEGSARAGLTLKTGKFEFQGNGKSKVRLNITSDTSKLNLGENCKMEVLIYSLKTHADLYQRAIAIIEGETNELNVRTDNYSLFNGRNFTAKTCQSINEMSSDAYLEVVDTLTMEASGNSSVYLYNNPKIIVNRLENTAKIQKKEK